MKGGDQLCQVVEAVVEVEGGLYERAANASSLVTITLLVKLVIVPVVGTLKGGQLAAASVMDYKVLAVWAAVVRLHTENAELQQAQGCCVDMMEHTRERWG